MKNITFIIHCVILFCVILLQAYFPMIYLGNIIISPDITLVYISIMAILYSRFRIILLAFILGLLQDFLTQVSLLGLFSFIKSLSAFYFGSIKLHESVWNINLKRFVLLLIYFLHFFIYFYVIINDNGSWLLIMQYSFLQTIFTFGIFWILNSYIFKRRLI